MRQLKNNTAISQAAGDTTGSADSTSGLRDNGNDGECRGHETLFFAGNTYHTFNGELVALSAQRSSRPGSAGGAPQGRYNPLTHTFLDTPDAAQLSRWQREGDASYSIFGRRPASALAGSSGSSTSGGRGFKETVGSLMRQDSSSSSSAAQAQAQDSSRPASAGGRRKQRAGDTW